MTVRFTIVRAAVCSRLSRTFCVIERELFEGRLFYEHTEAAQRQAANRKQLENGCRSVCCLTVKDIRVRGSRS